MAPKELDDQFEITDPVLRKARQRELSLAKEPQEQAAERTWWKIREIRRRLFAPDCDWYSPRINFLLNDCAGILTRISVGNEISNPKLRSNLLEVVEYLASRNVSEPDEAAVLHTIANEIGWLQEEIATHGFADEVKVGTRSRLQR